MTLVFCQHLPPQDKQLQISLSYPSPSFTAYLHRINAHKSTQLFNVKLNKPPAVSKTISYRCLSKINIDKFHADIRQSNIIKGPPDHLPKVINTYNSELTRLLDIHAPVKSKTMVERENSKWFNDNLSKLKREARALDRKQKRTGLKIDCEIYLNKCHEYAKLRQITKKNYYTDAVLECDGNHGHCLSL